MKFLVTLIIVANIWWDSWVFGAHSDMLNTFDYWYWWAALITTTYVSIVVTGYLMEKKWATDHR